jgi:MFS family permease
VTSDTAGHPPVGPLRPLRLHGWADRAVIGVALAAFAAGFGQFGLVAALGDVARDFGQQVHGASIADQVGLSGTELGVGLAIIRLASLGSLPFIGAADRVGRRTMLLGTLSLGLAMTVVSALSPGYWWFVAIFACGRPLLSATNALAQVAAAEQTATKGRASAVALTAAGYGVGAGLIAIVDSLASGALGFRGMFALAVVPLALVPLLRKWIEEPDRFTVESARDDHPLPVLGPVGPRFRRRLAVVALLGAAISVITGPANSFVFLYAQNVLHQPGYVTAAMVVGAGVAGLGGLLLGRWLADHLGRRPTGALAMLGLAGFGTLAYAGSRPALVIGYIMGVLAGSVIAPPLGSLLAELFPTSVRASVAGWWVAAGVIGAGLGLVAFGAVADAGDRFGRAAVVTFLPAALAAGLFWLVPETRGKEPEDLWPDGTAAPSSAGSP